MIHNKVVSDSTATTKQSAKKAAIEVLLNELRRTCFTLEVNHFLIIIYN